MFHKSVLLGEVISYLNPKPNENFIDGTIGQGGHAIEILKRTGPDGKLLGIDLDAEQIKNASLALNNFKKRLILANDSYGSLKKIVEKYQFRPVDGILLDLGMSSWQLEESGRGFTFQKDEPLDMRYGARITNDKLQITNYLTAEVILNDWPEQEIEKVLREYGEERFSKKIAQKICEERKIQRIKNTFQLVDIIRNAIPSKFHHQKIHFATRSFQALRIAVNRELDNLKDFLPKALEILEKGGRLVIISFHSLEDRIVKNFFKEAENKKLVNQLTKKPVTASAGEISSNPRSRSAKLRAIIKISN